MTRLILLCVFLWGAFISPLSAQVAEGAAIVDPTASHIKADWRGNTDVRLRLTQGVPFRVFTLDKPARLVVDFREIDWSGVTTESLMRGKSDIAAVRFGNFQPGWSRLVADLSEPVLPKDVAMRLDEETGQTVFQLRLSSVTAEAFALAAGAPKNVPWPKAPNPQAVPPVSDDRFVVVLDPGHGGIDPGAEREGVSEKELMLDVALALRDALESAADVDVVLTRDSDLFVALESRVAKAHQARADLFLSLHADALSEGGAQGATVYLLSEEASDAASAHLAARHNRADVLAGADLTGSDDEVTSVLLDLARQETEPRSERFAGTLIKKLSDAGGPMNSRPLRRAGFSVLKSADIPSALVEIGFLSSQRDLANLRDPEWRAGIVEALTLAILDWRDRDEAIHQLVRQ